MKNTLMKNLDEKHSVNQDRMQHFEQERAKVGGDKILVLAWSSSVSILNRHSKAPGGSYHLCKCRP